MGDNAWAANCLKRQSRNPQKQPRKKATENTEILWPRIPWSGKAATKGYWKCHGRKHTENTEIFGHEFHEFTRKLVNSWPSLFRVLRAKFRGKKSLLL